MTILSRTGVSDDKDDGVATTNLIPHERGGMRWHIRPNWASADVTAGTVFTLYSLVYNPDAATNYWSLAYVVGTGWRFRACCEGTSYDAVVDVPVLASREYDVAVRWTSDLLGGEWDKPRTLTLQVRRVSTQEVLGTTDASYQPPVYATGATFGLGQDTLTTELQFDGYVIEARESPFPPSDAQMLADTFTLAETEVG